MRNDPRGWPLASLLKYIWKIYTHKNTQLHTQESKPNVCGLHEEEFVMRTWGFTEFQGSRASEKENGRQCLEHPHYLKDAQLVPHLWLNICLILMSLKTGFFCFQFKWWVSEAAPSSHLSSSEEQLQLLWSLAVTLPKGERPSRLDLATGTVSTNIQRVTGPLKWAS